MHSLYAKVHQRINRKTGLVEATVIAACDADLLGKIFSSPNGVELNLKIYRRFYEGEKVTPTQLAELLKDAENVNLVGKNAIIAASRVLPLTLSDARTIGGVPHIQFYKV